MFVETRHCHVVGKLQAMGVVICYDITDKAGLNVQRFGRNDIQRDLATILLSVGAFRCVCDEASFEHIDYWLQQLDQHGDEGVQRQRVF